MKNEIPADLRVLFVSTTARRYIVSLYTDGMHRLGLPEILMRDVPAYLAEDAGSKLKGLVQFVIDAKGTPEEVRPGVELVSGQGGAIARFVEASPGAIPGCMGPVWLVEGEMPGLEVTSDRKEQR